MAKRSITLFWLWGGLGVILLQIGAFIYLEILSPLTLIPGVGILCGIPILIAAFAEIPPVYLGRALNLTIENNTYSYIFHDLTPFGYLFVELFWIVVGALIGLIFDVVLGL